MTGILVACVGNIFKSDDGFGVAVAAELADQKRGDPFPNGVRVIDFGIRSVHLVYELLAGYDVLVLVDAVGQQSGPPGTLYLIEPDLPDRSAESVVMDPHDLSPGGAMSLVPTLGGQVDRILVVGCQPESLDDGIGLSETVQAAVRPAAAMVRDVVERELSATVQATTGGG